MQQIINMDIACFKKIGMEKLLPSNKIITEKAKGNFVFIKKKIFRFIFALWGAFIRT